MTHLTKLITLLPPLKFNYTWSGLWLSDSPLRFTLSSSGPTGDGSHSSITSNAGIDPSKIATRYLVSDVMDCSTIVLPARIYRQLQSPDSDIFWLSSLKWFMPRSVSACLVPPTFNSPNTRPTFAATGSEWVPSCDHWVLRVNSFKVLPIRRISNETGLLEGHRVWRNSQLWSSSLCQICKSESETIQHFFISCLHKWSFWESQLAALQLTAKFPTPESVWLSIYTLHSESSELIDEAIILSLGTIL
ncbi:hypothetical protein BD770DRAFT_406014 [Pilaira anomala]|nr:hypothetical protein BD770DRAFT_406014 [Pilaira anomala]